MINNKEDINKIKELEVLAKDTSTTTRNLLFFAGTFALLLVAIMFSTQIISGFLALIVLIIGVPAIAILARAIYKADPYIRQVTANKLLKLQYAEAAKNAIYQLDNDVLAKTESIKLAKQNRDKVGGQIATLQKDLSKISKSSPYYANMKKTLTSFQKAYDILKHQISVAEDKLDDFKLKVQEYKQYAKFTESAEAIAAALNSDNTISDMLSTVAFESIDQDFNTAMVTIENLVQDMED